MRLFFAALSLCLLAVPASADTVVTKEGKTYRCPSAFGMTQSSRVFTCPSYKIENPESVTYLRDGVVGEAPTPAPSDPAPTDPAPVGFNLQAALDAAPEGATVIVPPGVHKTTGAITKPGVTVRGADATSTIDCSGMRPAWGKACIVFVKDATVENLKITGAAISATQGGNAACFRNEPGINAVVRGVECWGSQNGILGSGGSWVVENSVFRGNGSGTGQTHNIYVSGDCSSATFRNVVSTAPKGGHALKSRCKVTTIDGLTADAPDGAIVDIATGGSFHVTNSKLRKPANSPNNKLVTWGVEGCSSSATTGLIETTQFLEGRTIGNEVWNKCSQALRIVGSPLPANTRLTGNVVVE